MRMLPPAGFVVALVLLLGACAPNQPGPGVGTPAQPSAPKTLTLALQREPTDGFLGFSGGARRGGANNAQDIVHNRLVIVDEQRALQPQLATELPSVERGTWRINSDGTMDTIWTIRPNVKWHDGTPFTSSDLLFAYTVKKDFEVPWRSTGPVELMESVASPDAHTLAIHWSSPYFRANEGSDLAAMPRHLMEADYREDKSSFLNSPRHTIEFVGLGPYRLVKWEQGSVLEFVRFDDYYLGRPPFDSVTLRIIGDANAMVANLLSGQVDVLLPLGVDVEAAFEVKRRWESPRNQVRFIPTDLLWLADIQHRPEYARPRNGLTNRNVRQALYQATDRQVLTDVLTGGVASAADSWLPPTDALHAELAQSIPQFPYDLARAQQLLADAGWARGPDGVLVDGQSGERLEIELRGYEGVGIEKQLAVVADGWKGAGAQGNIVIVPVALQADLEYAAKNSGVVVQVLGGPSYYENRLHSKLIAGPANRWTGRNRLGYSNPRVDELLDRLVVTIDRPQWLALHGQLLQEQMGEVPMLPLYWEVSPVIMGNGVAGPIGGNGDVINNFIAWDRKA